MSKQKKFIIFLVIIFGFIPSILLLSVYLGFRINITISYPYGLYWVDQSDKNLSRGKMVFFCPPDSKAFREANKAIYIPRNSLYCSNGYMSMIKKIAGLPGDIVEIKNQHVYINDILQKNSRVFSMDTRGNTLRALPKKRFVIPEKMLFVMSDYEEYSFDSRYFGPIPSALIEGIIYPIWVYDTDKKIYDRERLEKKLPSDISSVPTLNTLKLKPKRE